MECERRSGHQSAEAVMGLCPPRLLVVITVLFKHTMFSRSCTYSVVYYEFYTHQNRHPMARQNKPKNKINKKKVKKGGERGGGGEERVKG